MTSHDDGNSLSLVEIMAIFINFHFYHLMP